MRPPDGGGTTIEAGKSNWMWSLNPWIGTRSWWERSSGAPGRTIWNERSRGFGI